MRVRFTGGPWDGVEFESAYHPDQILFRDMQVEAEEVEGEPLQMVFHTAKREHHQYLMDGSKREPEGEVMRYRYAPGEPVWWEECR